MQSTLSRQYQQLQPENRATLASLVQQRVDFRAIAEILGRSPSTISRELLRNAQPAGYANTYTCTRPTNAAYSLAPWASSIAVAFCLI